MQPKSPYVVVVGIFLGLCVEFKSGAVEVGLREWRKGGVEEMAEEPPLEYPMHLCQPHKIHTTKPNTTQQQQ